jgi:hypothetical protein
MKPGWTWGGFFFSLLGVLQWIIAALAVAGTLALFGWILLMLVRKDKPR